MIHLTPVILRRSFSVALSAFDEAENNFKLKLKHIEYFRLRFNNNLNRLLCTLWTIIQNSPFKDVDFCPRLTVSFALFESFLFVYNEAELRLTVVWGKVIRWFTWLQRLSFFFSRSVSFSSMKLVIKTLNWNWNRKQLATLQWQFLQATSEIKADNTLTFRCFLAQMAVAQWCIYRLLWFFSGPNVTSQLSCFLGKRCGSSSVDDNYYWGNFRKKKTLRLCFFFQCIASYSNQISE